MQRRFFSRFAGVFLSAAVLSSVFSGTTVFAAEKTLTLSQAVSLTLKNSNAIQKVVLSKVKKEIELKQAYAAVADTRKNESTVRFSLLFNIKFPEKHGMPKEIELLTKIPDIQSEIKVLNAEKQNAILSETAKCEQQFYTVVFDSWNIEYCKNLQNEVKTAQSKILTEFYKGNALKSDVEYMAKQVSDADSAYTDALSAYEKDKEKLSAIIGADVSHGYDFKCSLPEVDLHRSELDKIKDYTLKYDYTYYKASENKNAADSRTETVKSVYSGRYGSDAANVMSYINSCKSRGEKIDYEVFINKYNSFLSAIERPWNGSYVINLIFFKIYIPKEWFKGTYSGARYLEDERYSLFVSLAELDEAEQDRVSAYDELINAVTDGYYALNESKDAYNSAKSYLAAAEKSYSDALKDNLAGLVSFTDLYDKKVALLQQQKSIYEMRTDYAKSISAYNLTTAGYISDRVLNGGESGIKNYEDGISAGEQTDDDTPSWYVNVGGASYKVTFGVKIPESYDVTNFEIFTSDGTLIGGAETDKTLNNISTVYTDTSLLTLKLYKDGKLKYTAEFDGMQYYGTLDLKSAEGGSFTGGTWETAADGMKATFTISTQQYDYDKFALYYGDKLIGEGTADKGVCHLAAVFADMTGFTVVLYDGNTEKARLKVKSTGSGKGVLEP